MQQKKNRTNFNFSYGELLQQAFEKSTLFRQDINTLISRGFSQTRLDAFDEMITEFQKVPGDITFIGAISNATQNKNETRKQIEFLVRDIVGIAEITFRNNKEVFKNFRVSGSGKLTDAELIIKAGILCDRATQYSGLMAKYGLTDGMICDMRTLLIDFEKLIKYLDRLKTERMINTNRRHEKANALYEEMVILCRIASNYFHYRDELRYSDYVIYHKSSHSRSFKPSKPEPGFSGRSIENDPAIKPARGFLRKTSLRPKSPVRAKKKVFNQYQVAIAPPLASDRVKGILPMVPEAVSAITRQRRSDGS